MTLFAHIKKAFLLIYQGDNARKIASRDAAPTAFPALEHRQPIEEAEHMSHCGKYDDSVRKINTRTSRTGRQPAKVSIETLRAEFRLDRQTGHIYRRKSGKRTGLPGKAEYCRVNLHGAFMYAHRIVWALAHGEWPDGNIDHINGDKHDNRPCNLRVATHKENMRNRKPWGKSKYLGVHWSKSVGKWRATIREDGRVFVLGYFDDELDAAKAYRDAAIDLFADFASHSLDGLPE